MAIPGKLGDAIVLTVQACEVASHRGNAERLCTRQKMEEGFLFYGIHGLGNRPPVDQTEKDTTPILPDTADAPPSVPDQTLMSTQMTTDLVVLQLFVKPRLFHNDPPRVIIAWPWLVINE